MSERDISTAVVKRLPRYYRYLGELMDEGIERVSSNDLANRMRVTASQIRQDLNNFGGFGQQGYGYNVEYLYKEIGKILGLDEPHNVIVIGAGNLGQAIAGYVKFERHGFKITGLFDINDKLVGKPVRDLNISHMDDLEEFLANHKVDIVALTLPKASALEIAKMLPKYGVHAIWNFAHVDLDDIDGLIVENVHLSDTLMRLSYNMAQKGK